VSDEFYSLSDKDTWQTPDEVTDALQRHVDIALDPCAGLHTFIGQENWTVETCHTSPASVDSFSRTDKIQGKDTYRKDGRVLRTGIDSLEREWNTGGLAFVNPPFSMKTEFIEKTLTETNKGNIDGAIVLTPDATDVQSWWHDKLAPAVPVVWFSRGRINFIEPDTGNEATNPTFGTALHFVGPMKLWPDALFDELDERGDVLIRWREHES